MGASAIRVHQFTPVGEGKPTLKKGASLKDESRMYCYEGRRSVSVTTVLGLLNDFLFTHLSWTAGEVARIANDPASLIDKWVESENGWDIQQVIGLSALQDVEYVKNIGPRKLKAAADRGRSLHELKDLYGLGHPPTYDDGFYAEVMMAIPENSAEAEDVFPYMRSLTRWWEQSRPVLSISEMPVFSDLQGTPYAGTLDGLIEFDNSGPNSQNGRWYGWFDLKTSDSFKRSWAAQLAAYSKTDFGVLSDGNSCVEFQMPSGLPCGVLMVTPERVLFRDMTNVVDNYYEHLFIPALKAWYGDRLPLPPKATVWDWREDKPAKPKGAND